MDDGTGSGGGLPRGARAYVVRMSRRRAIVAAREDSGSSPGNGRALGHSRGAIKVDDRVPYVVAVGLRPFYFGRHSVRRVSEWVARTHDDAKGGNGAGDGRDTDSTLAIWYRPAGRPRPVGISSCLEMKPPPPPPPRRFSSWPGLAAGLAHWLCFPHHFTQRAR